VADASPAGASVAAACTELGARVARCGAIGERTLPGERERQPADEAATDEAAEQALVANGPIPVLAVDGAALSAAGSAGWRGGGADGLPRLARRRLLLGLPARPLWAGLATWSAGHTAKDAAGHVERLAVDVVGPGRA